MQPAAVRTHPSYNLTRLREWFDAIDTNKDGVVSVNEWLLWALGQEAERTGGGSIGAFFRAFDRDNTGCLDLADFQRARFLTLALTMTMTLFPVTLLPAAST